MRGYLGPQGPRGYPGIKGQPGKDGIPGKNGKQGIQGIRGKSGGLPGKDGLSGKDGKDGKNGAIGPKGDSSNNFSHVHYTWTSKNPDGVTISKDNGITFLIDIPKFSIKEKTMFNVQVTGEKRANLTRMMTYSDTVATSATSTPITYSNLNNLATNNLYVSLLTYAGSNVSASSTYNLQFPSSYTSNSGGTNVQTATSSEAFWYFAQLAYDNGNTENLQQLLNGYCYLSQIKQSIVAANTSDSYLLTAGLIGWQPTIGVPPNCLSDSLYSIDDSSMMATATDADMHLVMLMYYAAANMGITTLYYPTIGSSITTTNGVSTYSSMSQINISIASSSINEIYPQTTYEYPPITSTITTTYPNNLLLQSFCSFFTSPISNISYPYDAAGNGFYFTEALSGTYNPTSSVNCNTIYNPILCNDQYGGGSPPTTALNPSYLDPVCLLDIYNAAIALGFTTSTYVNSYTSSGELVGPVYILSNYANAISNSISYLTALQSYYPDTNSSHINSYGLPDNPYWAEEDSSQMYSYSQGSSGNQPHFIGYDSIRVQQNLGYFAYLVFTNQITSSNPLYSQSNINNLIIIGIRMMNYLIYNCTNTNGTTFGESEFFSNGIQLPLSSGTSFLNGGALIAPLCVGMSGLINYTVGDTTSSYYSPITPSDVTAIQSTLNSLTIDTTSLTPGSTGWINWQEDYFSTVLTLIGQNTLSKMTSSGNTGTTSYVTTATPTPNNQAQVTLTPTSDVTNVTSVSYSVVATNPTADISITSL